MICASYILLECMHSISWKGWKVEKTFAFKSLNFESFFIFWIKFFFFTTSSFTGVWVRKKQEFATSKKDRREIKMACDYFQRELSNCQNKPGTKQAVN